MSALQARLGEAQEALESARWQEAREAFEAALADGETPDGLDGLGLALWFLGRVDEGVAARERAFEGYAREGRCDEAARLAVWVSHQHLIAGRASAARGWLARAERAVENAGTCAGQGWVAVERARHVRRRSSAIAPAMSASEIPPGLGACLTAPSDRGRRRLRERGRSRLGPDRAPPHPGARHLRP